MKAEFELSVDSEGNPTITFLHHDRNKSIEQMMLKIFVERAKKKGLEIKYVSGYLESGTNSSWEQYEIKVKK